MNLNDLQDNVTSWAHARNLINGTSTEKQLIKLMEELGEVATCVSKDRISELEGELGDMLVVMNNIAQQNGLTLESCLNKAWLKIKDRKGMMIDGYYVKEADLPPISEM